MFLSRSNFWTALHWSEGSEHDGRNKRERMASFCLWRKAKSKFAQLGCSELMVSDTSFLIDKVDSCLGHSRCEVGEVNWLFKYPLSSIFDLNQWAWHILYKMKHTLLFQVRCFYFGVMVQLATYVDCKSLHRAGQDRNKCDRDSRHEHKEHPVYQEK